MRTDVKKLPNSHPELTDIVDATYLQAMHDTFSDDMQSKGIEVASAILDEEAKPITFERSHCSFCREVRRTKAGAEQCRTSDKEGIVLAKKQFEKTGKPEPVFYICKQGLLDACAPIIIGTKILAYFFCGQIRCPFEPFYSPDHPILDDLISASRKTKEEPDTAVLEKKFQEVDTVDQNDFDIIKNGTEAIVKQLNSIVRKLHEWRRIDLVDSVDSFRRKASQIQTVEELFDLMVDSLPKMIDAKYCSIFTVQHDEYSGRDQLVLRKTTYPDLKPKENIAIYEKGEGLTGWVWENARSLRIKDLRDAGELSQYKGLKWEGKHNDSAKHKGFLAVPMFGRNRVVTGVIRVPLKKHGNFDIHDEIFLTFLARYLSWVMEYQASEEKFERAIGPRGLISAAEELSSGLSYSEVLDAAVKSSIALFGSKDRKHFINILEPDQKHWRVERIDGELPLKKNWKQRVYHIDEGISGRAIRTGPFLSSDIKDSISKNEYVDAVEGARSAISVPLRWGADDIYGTISIVSARRFDFSGEKDLRLLEALGKLTGAAIRNAKFHESVMYERAKAYSVFAKSTLHCLLNSLLPVEQEISTIERLAVEKSPIRQHAESCQFLLNQMQNLLLHLRKIAFPSEASLRTEDLNSIVKSIIDRTHDRRVKIKLSSKALMVMVDPFMFELILYELLTNAFRYIPKESGEVTVLTKLDETDAEGTKCIVEVSDNGQGILPDKKKKIFLDGYRGDEQESEEHFGLGLFLAQQLATAMGGEIVEKGEYGKGARFIVKLPYKA